MPRSATVPPISRAALAALLAGALGACTSVQVRSVGTNTGQAAYDLGGPTLALLDAEARRLCPRGFEVWRQWSRVTGVAAAGGGSVPSATAAAFSYDLQPDAAQMSVVCRSPNPA